MWPDRIHFVSSGHLVTVDFAHELIVKPLLRLRISQPSPFIRIVENYRSDDSKPEMCVIFVLYPTEVLQQTQIHTYIGVVHDVTGREAGPFAAHESDLTADE